MRLPTIATLLSLLALSRYTNAAAVVGHPYRTELLGYSPARGEFQNVVGNTLTHQQGYVRYLDSQGVQHIIGYKYPAEPVQQSRRITNEEYLKQLIKLSLNKDEAERSKARDEHFRLWSMNQYDQYRQEIERLKAAGQEPTADLLTKVKTFEDIIIATRRGESSTDGATTEETAQIKQVRDEHLRLWNAEAALLRSEQMLKQQHSDGASIEGATPAIHLRFQSAQADTKSDAASALVQAPAHVEIVGETAEQKKAREEHLRIYQEQLQRLQQAHAEAAKAAAEESSSAGLHQVKDARAQLEAHAEEQQHRAQQIQQVQNGAEHVSYIQETPEVQQAKAEHLRLWQEAKQRAEKEAQSNPNEPKAQSTETGIHQHTERHLETKNMVHKPEQIGFTSQEKQPQQQSFTFMQPDSIQYAEEQKRKELKDRSDTVTIFADAQSNEKYQEKLYGQHQQQSSVLHSEHNAAATSPQLPTPVQDTPEVQRARAEHLRILEELQKQAQFNAEKLRDSSKSSSDGAIQQSTLYKHPQYAPTITTNEKSATKSLTGIGHQQAQGTVTATDVEHQSQGNVPVAAVQDTIEVQRAREEHLKLLKEAFSKASEYQAANAASTNEASSALYVTQTTDKLAEQLNNKEGEEEARLRIEEAKQHEAERLAEEARLKEEARLQAEELELLQLDEQRRQEQERLELTRLGQIGDKKKDDEHLTERPQLPGGEELPKQTLELLGQKPIQTERNEKLDADVNSQLLRFGGNQVGGGSAIPTTAYFVGAQQPIAQQQQQSAQLKNYAANPGYYYLRDVTKGYLNVDKPYILQYIPNQQQLGSKDAYAPTDAIPLTSALAALNQIQNYEKPIEKPLAQLIPIAPGASPFSSGPIASAAFVPASAPIAPAPALFAPVRSPITAPIAPFAAISPSASLASITPFASSSNAMKIDYGSDPGLAALEKATRDHFRAHEIALEQLRLSNQKQPTLKDCY